MSNIDILEAASQEPYSVRLKGQICTLPDPQELRYDVLIALLMERIPPGLSNIPMPTHARERVFAGWAARYDLPDGETARRLAYLVDRYRSALTYDLQTICGVDLGQLWRARRWRTLIDYIDHLPGNSWYHASVVNDEEHAEMLAKTMAARAEEGEAKAAGPPMQHWTPEVEVMTRVLDAVHGVSYAIQATNYDGKGPKPKFPEPSPRPTTVLDRLRKQVEYKAREEKHRSLVHRLLPHKRES